MPKLRVYAATATGALAAAPKVRVYGVTGTGTSGARLLPAPVVPAQEPQERVFLSIDTDPSSAFPDSYVWRVISGPPVTIEGFGDTVSFVTPSVMPPTAQVKVGVSAVLSGFASDESVFTIPVLPQTAWSIGASNVWVGAKANPIGPPAPPIDPPVDPPATLKLTGGLVVVDNSKLAAVAGAGVNHIVVKVPWSSIEPSQGTYNWAPIENALNANPGANITLRIQAGQWSPAWLMTATGRISITNNARATTVDCPHWWKPLAMDSWQNMITAAGARYDSKPRVVMVSADLAMVVYSEPYILGSHQPSGAALFLAGCNQTTQVACIKRSVADTIVAFPTTHVELALHSDMQIPVSGGMIFSWPIGRQLAYDLAVLYGKHIVFSDYGLGTVDTAAANVPTGSITTENKLYAWMKLRSSGGAAAWAGPVTFQLTVGKEPQTQATYTQAAQNAIDLGGSQCETAGWGLAGSNLATLDAGLKANALNGI